MAYVVRPMEALVFPWHLIIQSIQKQIDCVICAWFLQALFLTSYNGNGISYNTYGYVSSYNGYNYSPEWRRFMSPDDTSYLDPENVNGLNLYAKK